MKRYTDLNRYMVETQRRADATTPVAEMTLLIEASSEDEAEAIADGILNAALGIASHDIDATTELA